MTEVPWGDLTARLLRGRRVRLGVLWGAVAAWAAVVAAGLFLLSDYSNTAGASASAPRVWPETSNIARNSRRPTLVVFLHPCCACSHATVSELERLVARCRRRLDLRLLFFKPGGTARGWERTGLWSAASRIPGATLAVDVDGTEASRFGALTSGYTLLYGAEGEIVFQGGVTPARAHHGDSDGREAILSHLNGTRCQRTSAPVFGCAIFSSGTTPRSAGPRPAKDTR